MDKYMVVLAIRKDELRPYAKVVEDNYLNRHIIYKGTIGGIKRILDTGTREECQGICTGYNYGRELQK